MQQTRQRHRRDRRRRWEPFWQMFQVLEWKIRRYLRQLYPHRMIGLLQKSRRNLVTAGWIFLGFVYCWGVQLPAFGQDCNPTTSTELNELLKQSQTKIYLVKFDDAIDKLRVAEATLPCVTDILPKEMLGRLFLYRGVAAFNKGSEAQATTYFRQALAVDKTIRWDDRFGTRPREIFIEAKEAALLAPKGSIRIPVIKPGAEVFVDGEIVQVGSTLLAVPGRHLLQVRSGSQFRRAELFDVAADVEVNAPVPADLVSQVAVAPTKATPPPAESRPPAIAEEVKKPPQPKEPKQPFDRKKLAPVAYGMFGLSGACLAAGTFAGFVTRSTQATLLSGEYHQNRDSAERDTMLAKQKTTALLANASFGGAILLGGAGATVFVFSRSGDHSDQFAGFTPWLNSSSAGISWSGSF